MEGGHGLVVNPTGDDVSKVREVYIYVEGKAMHGHPSAGFYAQGTDFSWILECVVVEPYACKPFYSPCRHTVFRESQDDGFFQVPQVAVDVGKEVIQIQDRIAHQLPGTMVGDVSPRLIL